MMHSTKKLCMLALVLVMAMAGVACANDLKSAQAAASQGDHAAQYLLGKAHESGNGVAQDYTAAIAWFRKAAEQGHVKAQAALGLLYETGRGTPRDYNQALFWHRKAADSGHAESQKNLGVMYENGQGAPRDYKMAAYWYGKSANQGNDKAQRNLARFYQEGLAGKKDEFQALHWYRLSAGQGNAKAQLALAEMLASSNGAQERIEAYMWFELAASRFMDPGLKQQAVRDRDTLAKKMAVDEVAEAQRRAKSAAAKMQRSQ